MSRKTNGKIKRKFERIGLPERLNTKYTAHKDSAYLCDPRGMFEIESLSKSLYVKLERSNVWLVQLTGTMTENAIKAIGTNNLSLH